MKLVGVLLYISCLYALYSKADSCTCFQPDFESAGYRKDDVSGPHIMVPTKAGLLSFNGTDFGASCKAWMVGYGVLCQNLDSLPSACLRRWCYVDPKQCSTKAVYPSEWFDALGLHFSHEACNDTQAQRDYLTRDNANLQGVTLRFAYPMEMRPWHYKVNGEWTGVMPRFFELVQARTGFTVMEKNVSVGSLLKFESKWDACIHDVMMGLIDVCPTAAWETPSRWQMASFTPPLLPSPLRLMVKKIEEANMWDPRNGYKSVYFSFLRPFSPGLWLVILGVTFLSTTLVRFVDGGSLLLPGQPFSFNEVEAMLSGKAKYNGAILKHLAEDIFNSWTAVFTTERLVCTRTIPGHLIGLAAVFLATVVISSYTANLATVLVTRAKSHQGIAGFQDCDPATPGLCEKVCVATQLEQLTRELHPTMNLVLFPSSTLTMKGLADGNCDAAIVPEHDVRAREDFQKMVCDESFILVGEPMADMFVGVALSTNYVKAYSNHVMQLLYEHRFTQVFDKFRYKIADRCETTSDKDVDDLSIEVVDLFGVFLCFFVVAAVALLCHALDELRKRCKGDANSHAASDAKEEKELDAAEETELDLQSI